MQASRGDAALELAREVKPAVAVLDVGMPGLDGLEVLEAIRADASLAATKVLLLTAKAQESDVRRGAISIESVLEMMKEQGARAKLVVLDASRRNPYERRFRAFSHGLAPINAADNALQGLSATETFTWNATQA